MSTDISKKALKPKPSTFGGPWRVVLTTLAIFFLSQIVAGVVALGLLSLVGADTSLDNSSAAQFVYVLLAEGLAVGLVFLALSHRGLKRGAIGLGRRPNWRDLRHAAGGFVIFYVILIIAGIIVNFFAPSITNEQQDVGFNTLNTFMDGVLAFVALVLLPPIGEEILVRGYLYSGLRSKMKYLPALIITSLLFGAAHLAENDTGLLWSGALDTFILSVVLVYLRENTGALYAGMLVHMANNIIAFTVHFH